MDRIKKAIKLVAAGLILPLISFAQLQQPQNPGLPVGSGTISGEVEWIIQLLLAFAGIVAVLYLIIGGFRYITAAGNEETAEQAKKTIQNSIIGLIVILLSYVIVTVIVNAALGNV
ncbi:MAG: hypothetical protein A2660_01370 [Candidatus Doudnabacteria bacterium RIFCSPHIGHO2_01_FULL_45_18]|uniref:Uncharacterized protein n=1 Tax=Candidatus Doudnabacteria bacterium RIFCSPHIGHO2_01_FULL_45_18 TaxID=1817823 RepID=A0A1F5NSG9_9BACT|nr:MAG: hypothetical protein A2660_01370 [Candidatus Doudnabacteria bacterium RIFCSPHIGHO2_01_FULL_45_18]